MEIMGEWSEEEIRNIKTWVSKLVEIATVMDECVNNGDVEIASCYFMDLCEYVDKLERVL